jgi:hypothetical protein
MQNTEPDILSNGGEGISNYIMCANAISPMNTMK